MRATFAADYAYGVAAVPTAFGVALDALNLQRAENAIGPVLLNADHDPIAVVRGRRSPGRCADAQVFTPNSTVSKIGDFIRG